MKKRNKGIIALAMTFVMMFMMSSAVFADSWTYQDRISVQTGEPVHIVWNASPANTGTLTAVDSSYYPSTFVLWIGDGSAPTVSNGSATYLYETQTTLDDNTVVTNKAYQITLTGAGTIKVTLDSTTEYTIANSAPQGTAPSAALPTAFNGYLPLGQFATGAGWGTAVSGSSYKFLSGYSSTGISLGAAGGFANYDFYANNASTHPYGVDFIVYGNAFSGNPEAGAVKVYGFTSADDTTGEWYDLAGSQYYGDLATTKNYKDVSWKLVVSSDDNAKGIWYQVTDAGTAPSSTGWTRFSKGYGWWPFANASGTISDAKGYGALNGISFGTAFSNDDVSVNAAWTQITFKKVCLVKDTDTTNDYQYGYFDIHANGSSYGTASNPYTITNTETGGDGYDLSWAVNSNGEPVALDHITKVRLYTCAAMNSTGTAFTTPSIFGETSAEVCGIYGVNGTSGSGASCIPTIKKGTSTIATSPFGVTNVALNSNTTSLKFTSNAENIYVNGSAVSSGTSVSFTVASGESKYVQVITQTGTEEPYVTVIKLYR